MLPWVAMSSRTPESGCRRSAAPAVLALGVLALCGAPATAAEDGEWTFRVGQGEAMATALVVRNTCVGEHEFRVSAPEAPWVKFDEPVEALRIAGRSSHTVSLRFDTAGLAPGVYRAVLLVDCKGCAREQSFVEETEEYVAVRTCDGRQQKFPVEMTVVAAPAASAPPAEGAAPGGAAGARRAAGEIGNIDVAMRSRMADALARLAGKRGLTILPESLTVLSLPESGLVAGALLAGLESLTAAQLAAGAEVMFLHLELAPGAASQSPLQGEYTLLFQVGGNGTSATARLVANDGAVARELPVTTETTAAGALIHAAELAPTLLLPVWCAAPRAASNAAASPAPLVWRGWPVRCVSRAAG